MVAGLERRVRGALARTEGKSAVLWQGVAGYTDAALLGLILVASATELAAGTYNPFIYFRF